MDAVVERISLRLQVDMLSGCHRWTGEHDRDGYGLVTVNGKRRRVHREVYEREVGPIPAGHVVDHVRARGCMFRDCCNKQHLEAVTVTTNAKRVVPWNRVKNSCPAGHEYSDENTSYYVGSDGYVRRYCNACKDARKGSK